MNGKEERVDEGNIFPQKYSNISQGSETNSVKYNKRVLVFLVGTRASGIGVHLSRNLS